MNSIISSKSSSLQGHIRVPGDKSISHRALMFGAISEGETLVYGLLNSGDVLCTANALRALGTKITDRGDGVWSIQGVGSKGFKSPQNPLNMGNSGTSTRLLMGLVAGHDVTATFIGDESLSKRPMNRVVEPLRQMGASFGDNETGCLPLTLTGSKTLNAITYKLPVASAQVKSALLLAGLNAKGTTHITELELTRDYTETMLGAFGVTINTKGLEIALEGGQFLEGCAIDVPADPSSAAFPTVAALLSEGAEVSLNNIGINARRFGLYETLIEMGADITLKNKRTQGGEVVADLIIKGSPLKGVNVPANRVPSMIDEFPIFAVAAACADGISMMSGLAELRVKESDRLAVMAKGLTQCGVQLEEGEDTLIIHGTGAPPRGGVTIETALDHRIAMSFLVLGTVTDDPITIDDASPILTSFPNFIESMNDIGACFHTVEAQAIDPIDFSHEKIKHLR